MNLSEAFAVYLEGLGLLAFDPLGNAGDTFVFSMPDTPDAAVVISTYAGAPPDVKHAYDRPGLQVRVRAAGEDPRIAEARAWELYSELHDLQSVTLPGGTWLLRCSAQGTPTPMGQDASHRWEFVVNYQLEVHHLTTNRT